MFLRAPALILWNAGTEVRPLFPVALAFLCAGSGFASSDVRNREVELPGLSWSRDQDVGPGSAHPRVHVEGGKSGEARRPAIRAWGVGLIRMCSRYGRREAG